MKKEEYEKYIQNGCFGHLLVVTPKFEELMQKHGKYCKKCQRPFIPQPFYGGNYPRAYHYPTEDICGFCVYDMDAFEHSQIIAEEDY